MRAWRVAALGAVLGGCFGAAGCDGSSGKRAVADDAGAGGVDTAEAGAAGTPNGGASASAGVTSGGEGGQPDAEAGSPGTAGVAGSGGTSGGAGGAGNGPGPQLTSCDPPIVVDDAAAASILPDQGTIVQGPGGPTLLVWREGDLRKGRVLTGNALGKVVTFPDTVPGSEHYPHYAASGAGGLVYSKSGAPTSLSVYDLADDSWTTEDHDGLYWELNQFLANGDSLHVVTNSFGSIGSLQVRSKAGVWGPAAPVYDIGPDRIYYSRLLIDGQDRGAFVASTGQTAPALMGWAIRDGAVVGEASLPIPVSAAITELFSTLLPNADVLSVYQQTGDTVLRAVTFKYDEGTGEATFDEPIELEQDPSQTYGLAVSAAGDVTLSYMGGGNDFVRRRVDGVWGEPTPLSEANGWSGDPVVDANGTTFVARATETKQALQILSSAAGSFALSEPLDVKGNADWTYPQRPRLGLHGSGSPMVIWTGSNPSGGRDILLSVCR